MDSARCHLTESVRELYQQHTKVAVIPGGITKFLQPLDVGINKPFKDNLKRGWARWMNNVTKAQFTKSGVTKRMSYSEAAQLVADSFYAISKETIINSFRKAPQSCDVSFRTFAYGLSAKPCLGPWIQGDVRPAACVPLKEASGTQNKLILKYSRFFADYHAKKILKTDAGIRRKLQSKFQSPYKFLLVCARHEYALHRCRCENMYAVLDCTRQLALFSFFFIF